MSGMALRLLLRRVAHPVLVSPSAPRMVPVQQGISPPPAARFLKTSSQGEAKAVAEQSVKDFDLLEENARQSLAKFTSAVDDLKKVGNLCTVVAAAIPWIMIHGSKFLV